MQALARRWAPKGLVGALVMLRLVRGAGFHDRDDMNQSVMIATRLDDLGEERFLANVLNLHAGRSPKVSAFAGMRSRNGPAKRG